MWYGRWETGGGVAAGVLAMARSKETDGSARTDPIDLRLLGQQMYVLHLPDRDTPARSWNWLLTGKWEKGGGVGGGVISLERARCDGTLWSGSEPIPLNVLGENVYAPPWITAEAPQGTYTLGGSGSVVAIFGWDFAAGVYVNAGSGETGFYWTPGAGAGWNIGADVQVGYYEGTVRDFTGLFVNGNVAVTFLSATGSKSPETGTRGGAIGIGVPVPVAGSGTVTGTVVIPLNRAKP